MAVTIEFEPIGDIDKLQNEWLALEADSDCTYYHSWGWVGTWVRYVVGRIALSRITARLDGEIVGLVLAGESMRRAGIYGKRALYIQGTRGRLGRVSFDRGGFLIRRGLEKSVAEAYLHFLGAGVANGRWQRVVIGWVPPMFLELHVPDGIVPVARWREPNYVVELDRVREAGDYVALLGSRTRKSMRRSRRSYERRGPLEFKVATTVTEAQAFLDRLMVLHEAKWHAEGWPGNFADPLVRSFRRDLVRSGIESGEVQVTRTTAGGDEVGYLYNLVYRNRVISLDMGLCYEDNNDLQPGRISDWLNVEHYAAQGYDTFDYLGGDTQYKRSIGNKREELVWLLLRRDRLFDRVEERARHVLIAKVRETAMHRWQRRMRVAVSPMVDRVVQIRQRNR